MMLSVCCILYVHVIPASAITPKTDDPNKVEHIASGKSIKKSKLLFVKILPCTNEDPALCLSETIPSGLEVTVINEEHNQFCRIKAGDPETLIYAGEEWEGSKVVNINCDQIPPGSLGVVDYAAKTYQATNIIEVEDNAIIKDLDTKVRNLKLFDTYYRAQLSVVKNKAKLVVYRIKYSPSKSVYVMEYTVGMYSPLVLHVDVDFTLMNYLNDDSYNDCPKPTRAFMLEGRYFLEVRHCACETDFCVEIYYEIF
jgi:hypothetical protein